MMAYKEQEMNGLECGHLFCRSCWDSYLKVMVMDEGMAQVGPLLVSMLRPSVVDDILSCHRL